MDLTDIYRMSHPKITECTFFSRAHGIFSRIDHMLGYKTSFNKFMIIKIISSVFLNTILKLEINYMKTTKIHICGD